MKEFLVEQLFSGALVTAIPFAFIVGVVSFLSPCVLPLVPGYLSFAAGFSVSRGKVFLGSLLFVFGFSAVQRYARKCERLVAYLGHHC